jgi:phospholipid transport system substrate-binding protein
MKYKFLFISVILLFGSFVVHAEETEQEISAREVVADFQTQLLDTMKNGKKLGFDGRYRKLTEPVVKSHDLTKIARIVVGREWKKLTDEQKQKLVDVFSRLSIASYAHNFKDFSGEKFEVVSEEETPRGGVIVHTLLKIPGEKDVKLDYQMKKKGNDWRIINIIANGVSDLALKRSEYTSILKREGFDALLEKISGKIKQYSANKE